MLLPSRVEDYVSDENTVRAIDTYVDTLNLKSLKYTHTQESSTAGQPAYAENQGNGTKWSDDF